MRDILLRTATMTALGPNCMKPTIYMYVYLNEGTMNEGTISYIDHNCVIQMYKITLHIHNTSYLNFYCLE